MPVLCAEISQRPFSEALVIARSAICKHFDSVGVGEIPDDVEHIECQHRRCDIPEAYLASVEIDLGADISAVEIDHSVVGILRLHLLESIVRSVVP